MPKFRVLFMTMLLCTVIASAEPPALDAPEINGQVGASAVAILAGGVLVLRSRNRKK